VPDQVLARGFMASTLLFGAINFEVFGRLDGLVDDIDGYFVDEMGRMGRVLGLQVS
jgi:hypothetical protein